MSDVVTLTDPRLEPPLGADGVATLSNDEIRQRLDDLFRMRAAVDGRILELLGEVGRREAFRDEGAWDLPHLTGALCDGDITFDKAANGRRRVAQFRHLNALVEACLAALARSCCRLAGCAIADFGQLSHGAANRAVGIGTT